MIRDSVRTRRGFTLIELLVVIAIISVIAGLAVPTILRALDRAAVLKCAHHLQEIYKLALMQSDRSGSGCFPFAKGKAPRAHESLNELAADGAESVPPEIFVCAAADELPAVPDEAGAYLLTEETLSYAWTATRTKNSSGRRPLGSCKHVAGFTDELGVHDGHKGGINVLYTDGSVKFIPESVLDPETKLPPGLTR